MYAMIKPISTPGKVVLSRKNRSSLSGRSILDCGPPINLVKKRAMLPRLRVTRARREGVRDTVVLAHTSEIGR
jgi:hypothetical protein